MDKKGEQVHLFDTRLICASYHPNSSTRQTRRKASGGFLFGPSMLFALVATFCNTQPGPQLCVEEIVTRLPYHACTIGGQLVIAPWMADSKYRDNWNLTGWKCETPDYVVKGRV